MLGGMFDFVCKSIEEAEKVLRSQIREYDTGDFTKCAKRHIIHNEKRKDEAQDDQSLTKYKVCVYY